MAYTVEVDPYRKNFEGVKNDKITYDYESELRDPVFDIELETGQTISLIAYSKSDWTNKMAYSLLYSNAIKYAR